MPFVYLYKDVIHIYIYMNEVLFSNVVISAFLFMGNYLKVIWPEILFWSLAHISSVEKF